MTERILLLIAAVALGGLALDAAAPSPSAIRLPAAQAVGIQLDTLLIGGYTSGTFTDAVQVLASDLSDAERALVGTHLDNIFREVVPGGLQVPGRLRLAYERARRPDGTTRDIRILGAQLAVAGRVHTAYFYERGGRAGYFDPMGRSLEESEFSGPLQSYRLTSSFGNSRLHPILNRVLPHTGVDLAAPTGTPVRATADGVIAAAGSQGGYGLLVEVRHPNGYSTRYAHLSEIAAGVRAGSIVRRGELIGRVGMTGRATGPHLHYELRRQGIAVDPLGQSASGVAVTSLLGDAGWSLARRDIEAILARAPLTTPG